MKEKVEIEGYWQIHGKKSSPEWGILTIDGDEILLKVSVFTTTDPIEAFVKFEQQPEVEQIIHGCDKNDQQITLFGCICFNRGISGRRLTYLIHPLLGVWGQTIKDWNEPVGLAVRLELRHLHRWFGDKMVEFTQMSDGRSGWTLERIEDLVCQIDGGPVVRFCRSILPSRSAEEFKIIPNCHVWLIFDELQSLHQITQKWAPWVSDLFSLLMGTTIDCQEVSFSSTDPFKVCSENHEQLKRILSRDNKNQRMRISDPHTPMMIIPFAEIKNQMASLLQRWFEKSRLFKPALDLFTAVVFRHDLYANARFLFLTQALETYHTSSPAFDSAQLSKEEHKERVMKVVNNTPNDLKEWAKMKLQGLNYKPLKEKLLELFKTHELEANALFGDIDLVVRKIVFTRNHFTHHSTSPDAADLLKPMEVVQATCSLEAFFWIVFLKELGLHGDPITRVVRDYQGTKLVNLI